MSLVLLKTKKQAESNSVQYSLDNATDARWR